MLSLVWVGLAAALTGVPPEKDHLYTPDANGMWACLGHPEILIPFEQVNDDYCDCPDGSDEPGTSACPDTTFFCQNKGHISQFIPSSRVNDGVCDYDLCCDGSDEWATKGLCPDRCQDIHQQYVKDARERNELLHKGLRAKQALIGEAEARREEVRRSLIQKDRRKETLEALVQQRQAELDEILQAGTDQEVALPEEIARAVEMLNALEAQRQTLVQSAETFRSEAQGLDEILGRLKQEYNPNFNDPAVKEAIRSHDELRANNLQSLGGYDVMGPLQETIDLLQVYRPEECSYQPGRSYLPDWIQDYYYEQVRPWLEQNGLLAPVPSGKARGRPESHRASTARKLLEEAQLAVTTMQQDIDAEQADLDTQYGPDDVFRALKDQCVSANFGEYEYTLCFFGEAKQVGNGQNTVLGRFSKLDLDEKTASMFYDNGARCWNGPIRKTFVEFECGQEAELVSVVEPEKCEYKIRVRTPAVCWTSDEVDLTEIDLHDEL